MDERAQRWCSRHWAGACGGLDVSGARRRVRGELRIISEGIASTGTARLRTWAYRPAMVLAR